MIYLTEDELFDEDLYILQEMTYFIGDENFDKGHHI